MKNLLVFLLLVIAAVQSPLLYPAARAAAPIATSKQAYELGVHEGDLHGKSLGFDNAQADAREGRPEQTTVPVHIREEVLGELPAAREVVLTEEGLRFDEAAEEAFRQGYLNGLENSWSNTYQETYAKTRAESAMAVPAEEEGPVEEVIEEEEAFDEPAEEVEEEEIGEEGGEGEEAAEPVEAAVEEEVSEPIVGHAAPAMDARPLITEEAAREYGFANGRGYGYALARRLASEQIHEPEQERQRDITREQAGHRYGNLLLEYIYTSEARVGQDYDVRFDVGTRAVFMDAFMEGFQAEWGIGYQVGEAQAAASLAAASRRAR